MTIVRRALLPLPVLFSLAACVGAGTPPVVSLAGRVCKSDAEVLDGVIRTVAVGQPLDVAIDEAAACWRSPAGDSAYAAFVLPDATTPLMVNITSMPVGQSIFVPRLCLRDAQGRTRREIPRDAFLPRQAALFVAIRLQPDERYLVVASEPSSVGRQATHTTLGTNTTVVPVGPAYVPVGIGRDTTRTYTYAHNGRINVAVEVLPTIR